jgi:hypothetical protein
LYVLNFRACSAFELRARSGFDTQGRRRAAVDGVPERGLVGIADGVGVDVDVALVEDLEDVEDDDSQMP